MATKKKMLQAAAGQAGGAALDITDVFSTYLWAGNSTSGRNIVNNIDVSGEGGLVWIKDRTGADSNSLFTTDRGANKTLLTNESDAEDTVGTDVFQSFNSNGFTVGNHGRTNQINKDYASWTFRKAPKFFDVVTYTGTGDTTTQTISHNLGAVPGCIIVKRTDSADSWRVYHRGVDVNGDGQPWTDMLTLNTTAAASDFPVWGDTAPTSTEFTVGYESSVNGSGGTYVAYLFAHNDGDGGFGPDGDADIIKCGSYTGNGTKLDINLGFEAQWVLVKRTDTSGYDWHLFDVMRGMPVGSDAKWLEPNTSAAEGSNAYMSANSNGFTLPDGHPEVCANGGTYIYMAIRRGPLAQPESGTEVFALQQDNAPDNNAPAFRSSFPVDAAFSKNAAATSVNFLGSRLTGANYLRTNDTSAEAANTDFAWDYMNGWNSEPAQGSSVISYMWKRAPGFFDVVAYSGNGVRGRTVSHNLGVVPEMMWIKNRDDAQQWLVYIDSLGGTQKLYLSSTSAVITASIDDFNNTNAEATQFTLGNDGRCNANNQDYIAYLFATLPGVSKVGSYTGNGTSQTIDCGFTSGARFVLLKVASIDDDWFLWDSVRGINAGAEPYLRLNLSAAEITTNDRMDPHSSGFAVDGNDTSNNKNGETYIFYAIA